MENFSKTSTLEQIKESVKIVNKHLVILFALLQRSHYLFFDNLIEDDPNYDEDFIYELPRIVSFNDDNSMSEYVVKEIYYGSVHCVGIYDNVGKTMTCDIGELSYSQIMSIAEYISDTKPSVGIEMGEFLSNE